MRADAVGAVPRVAVVAPSFAVDAARLAAGCAALEADGYTLCRREDLLAADGYLAGDDARRAAELMQWVRDPEVEVLLCARGGYGAARVLPRLDPEAFRRARKILVGYSDATALLLWQRAHAGLVGLHGPMFDADAGPTPEERARLGRALRGEPLAPLIGTATVSGRAEGPLVGGSLTLVANSLGTSWEIDTRGAILMIEEIGERPYALDRHLQHLRDAGKLDDAVGFGVGHLVGCTDPKREVPTAQDVVRAGLAPLGRPVVTDLPFGHRSPNLAWPVGARGRIDGDAGRVDVLEPAVVPRGPAGEEAR